MALLLQSRQEPGPQAAVHSENRLQEPKPALQQPI